MDVDMNDPESLEQPSPFDDVESYATDHVVCDENMGVTMQRASPVTMPGTALVPLNADFALRPDMPSEQQPTLEQMKVLRLEPGDVLVALFPERLSPERYKRNLGGFRSIFPDHVCFILDAGATLQVVRSDKGEDCAETDS